MIAAPDLTAVRAFLLALQNDICSFLEAEDGSTQFTTDAWSHTPVETPSSVGAGGGITKVLEEGSFIEKAGVNFSHVLGDKLPPAASATRSIAPNTPFQAMGVSTVIHPRNPYAPTAHANVRFFLAEPPDLPPIWWFGGGFDLTPYYGFEQDCVHWHKTAKTFCDRFGPQVYAGFKKACDDYFYLKHRKEPRGIGGIFFDDLNSWGFERCFDFIQCVGKGFIEAYQPILHQRKTHPYKQRERAFQSYRRARYVEFNLVFDRGTLFGLQSGGRTESILISMPPQASWQYNWQPESGSNEAKLYDVFLKPRDWVG